MGGFELAKQLEHAESKAEVVCGTSWYMAPEVLDEQTELKSDVWSLGISLIELAEGKNPYDGYTTQGMMKEVCFGNPPSLSSSKGSKVFIDFVDKCLVKDVNERWSVKQLMHVSLGYGD